MASKKLEFSTRLTREDVAGLVEALIEGLKDGLLKVQKSDEVLEMPVPRVVDLEIEAEIDDEHAEFEIEVSWRINAENPDNVPENPAEMPEAVLSVKKSGGPGKIGAGTKKPSASDKKTGAVKKAGAASAKTASKKAGTAKTLDKGAGAAAAAKGKAKAKTAVPPADAKEAGGEESS